MISGWGVDGRVQCWFLKKTQKKTISFFIGMTIDVISFPLLDLQNWHFPSVFFTFVASH